MTAPAFHLPTEAERLQARETLTRLEGAGVREVRLQDLPAGVAALLHSILGEVAKGHAVQVLPVHAELSTQEAADLLGVSRPHLVKLLEEGALPHHKVGTHRRVKLDDVLTYRHQRDQDRRQALQALADLDQELGLL
ncbi:helix-turn-helix domain-containing protein [Deinococcus humi]|uniref:Excisionase family DNA binding protein n=1 Tax=Deinococcus humi TaxID=662880 RepID=A0A7W8JZM7_9DEIO|nr:helix-turn-helix domain-containing protein [Deinococcus humi]MBB5366172.1 excisionase family DNA binding protein [Deinococcus humi]